MDGDPALLSEPVDYAQMPTNIITLQLLPVYYEVYLGNFLSLRQLDQIALEHRQSDPCHEKLNEQSKCWSDNMTHVERTDTGSESC